MRSNTAMAIAALALAALLTAGALAADLRSAARGGDVQAQTRLGLAYLSGSGVPRDYAQARKWFRRAAEKGYAPAQYRLGVMNEEGRGGRRDYVAACGWYLKAARHGLADAQYDTGRCYRWGWLKPQSLQKMYYWMKKAADQGHQRAIEKVIGNGHRGA